MFSSRLPNDLTENRLTRQVRELRFTGEPLLDLTLSNPTRAGFVYPEAELREAFAHSAEPSYDPQPRGLMRTRETIAGYYGARGAERSAPGIVIDPGHIHCTSSSSEAYSMLFKLLCDPGDEICIPLPAYPLFSYLAALEAVTVRTYNLRLAPDGHWQIDMHSLDMAIGERTRAVIVVNPSNPAANYLRPAEFTQLDSLCARNGAALITDEVFWDFPLLDFTDGDDGRGVSVQAEADAGKGSVRTEVPGSSEVGTVAEGIAVLRQRTAGISGEALRFTINGLSKLVALPQMKLGWILTEGPTALRDNALTGLDLISDAYLSVGRPVMIAAPALLDLRSGMQDQIRTRCRRNLQISEETLKDYSNGGRLLRPEGGWSAVIALPDDSDEEALALQLLREQRVLVHPGYFFDFARGKYFVLSLLGEVDCMKDALWRIRQCLP